jgi:transcription elongation factor GreA
MLSLPPMEYLTKEKKAELENELKTLTTVRRKEIAEALEYAKSLGDLSENAEYHQAREDQGAAEERIAHLEQILKNAVVMDSKHSTGTVEVGTTVTVLKKGDKEERTFTLVGSEEADSLNGRISNESPLGGALLGKKAGDKVMVESPKGAFEYTIKKIA